MDYSQLGNYAPKYIDKLIRQNPEEGKALLDEVKTTELYQNDIKYRIGINSLFCIYHALVGEYSMVISEAKVNAKLALSEGLFEISASFYNSLANVYVEIQMLDKAFEIYLRVISLSKQHNIKNTLSIAYHNTSILFNSIGDNDKAFEYSKLAVENVDESNIRRYQAGFSNFASNLIIEYCRRKDFDKADELFAKIDTFSSEYLDKVTLTSIYEAKMFYHLYKNQYEEAALYFEKTIVLNDELNYTYNHLAILVQYAETCKSIGCDEKYYIPYLIASEKYHTDIHAGLIIKIYKMLLNYYDAKNDNENSMKIKSLYIYYLELYSELVLQQHNNAINILFDMEEARAENKLILQQNEQLMKLKDEAISRETELTKAYTKLQAISEIGKKFTSSLDMAYIAKLVYDNISSQIPVSSFTLMVVNEQERTLESVFIYEEGHYQPKFVVKMDDPYSVIARCYRENIMFKSNSLREELLDKNKKIIEVGEQKIESAIFFPVSYDDKIVGVCSVQTEVANSYTDEHVKFLEYLQPYLAISIINATRSKQLQSEITAHQETQIKLEELNSHLERLSSLDGLTGVNNRRLFDSAYSNIIEKVAIKHESISVFMIDIDFFKIYNDSFGHMKGDEALIKIATTLKNEFMAIDALFARFGGEEFVGVVKGQDVVEASNFADKLIDLVKKLDIKCSDSPIGFLSISVGVAYCNSPSKLCKSSLLKLSDDCLYEAKRSGRNRSVIKIAELQ